MEKMHKKPNPNTLEIVSAVKLYYVCYSSIINDISEYVL